MKNNILHQHFAANSYVVKSLIPNYFLIGQSAYIPVIFIPENSSSNTSIIKNHTITESFSLEKTFKII